jgi:hypothetical protein
MTPCLEYKHTLGLEDNTVTVGSGGLLLLSGVHLSMA